MAKDYRCMAGVPNVQKWKLNICVRPKWMDIIYQELRVLMLWWELLSTEYFLSLDFRKAVRPYSTRSSGKIEKLVWCGQFIQHQELAGIHQEEIPHWLSPSGGYPAKEQRSCSGTSLQVTSLSQQGVLVSKVCLLVCFCLTAVVYQHVYYTRLLTYNQRHVIKYYEHLNCWGLCI